MRRSDYLNAECLEEVNAALVLLIPFNYSRNPSKNIH